MADCFNVPCSCFVILSLSGLALVFVIPTFTPGPENQSNLSQSATPVPLAFCDECRDEMGYLGQPRRNTVRTQGNHVPCYAPSGRPEVGCAVQSIAARGVSCDRDVERDSATGVESSQPPH